MQKLKKRIAGILVATFMMGSCSVQATTQAPHTSSKWAEVSYNVTQDDPRVKISFESPTYPAANDTGYTIYYQNAKDGQTYQSTEQKSSSNSIILGESKTLQKEGSLKPGQLYKYWIVPYHIHYIPSENSNQTIVQKDEAKLSESMPGYFLTEFDPTAKLIKDESGNQQIQISTQYIPGATYEILYAKSKLTNYEEIKESLQVISADEYYDKVTGNVVYTLAKPEMGTEYSFYIRVIGLTNGNVFQGNAKDVANINMVGDKILGTKTKPKVIHVKVGTAVSITSVGNDYIQFSSKFSESFKQKIKYVQIVSINEAGEQTTIGEVGQSQFQYDEYEKVYYMNFTYNKPNKKSNYLVIFHFEDGKLGNLIPEDIITYTPPDKLSEPMRPQIPSPANKDIISQINSEGVEAYIEYFLKEDSILQNNAKAISINDTFHAYKNESDTGIQLIWSGQRQQGQKVQDPQITYDIWVFKDKVPNQYTQYKPLETGSSRTNIFNENGDVIGFKEKLTQYIEGDSVKKIEPNATYYIAVRSRNSLESTKYSEATVVAITLDKEGDISAPSVLGKPPLKVQEENVTQQMIPIEWQTEWYELKAMNIQEYDKLSNAEKELAKQWNSSAYESSESPYLRWTGDGEGRVETFTEGFIEKYAKDYLARKIVLQEDIKYEVKAISYDEVIGEVLKMSDTQKKDYITTPGALRVEAWIKDYHNLPQTDSAFSQGWEAITPILKEGDEARWQTQITQYTDLKGVKKKLEPNKRYIIMVRTYREVNQGNGVEKLYQSFPSYVLGLTKNNFNEALPIPNAPDLKGLPSESTFSSISVKWDYNYDFEYELRYSQTEDVEKAQVWPFEVSQVPGETGYVENGKPLTVTITGLLPEQEYYVWVRAIQKNTSPQVESDWSNVVILRTKEIDAPDVPYGLGLAGKQSLLEIGREIEPLGSDYMIVEWMRIDADIKNQNPAISYSYQVELADNDEFMDAITVVAEDGNTTNPGAGNSDYTAEVLAKNIVQFGGLRANTHYYIRVKTILTYTKPDTQEVIIEESTYTKAIKLKTSTSNDEYDGGENDNIIIYPDAVEESYKDGIWTYEIVDAAKIISQIQAQKKYLYTITLEDYKNRYDTTVRRVQMPKKVLDTLINQNMALQIITQRGIYEIPGKALRYYASGYNAKDRVQFELTQMDYFDIILYARNYPEYYRTGEKLEITIENKSIQKLESPMTVKIKRSINGMSFGGPLIPYQYQYDIGKWYKYPSTLDVTDNNYLIYSTPYTGLHALYETVLPSATNGATYAMSELASAYQITGLGTTYTKTQSVGASQYVKLILGIQLGKSPINLSTQTTTSDYTKAKAAGIYTSSNRGMITKEQALAGIVRLYEINHGYAIKPSNQVFNTVSATYREAASKAYAIGLIESIQSPQGTVNYETLCDWIAQVIE